MSHTPQSARLIILDKVTNGGDYLEDPEALSKVITPEEVVINPDSPFNLTRTSFKLSFYGALTNLATRISSGLQKTDLLKALNPILNNPSQVQIQLDEIQSQVSKVLTRDLEDQYDKHKSSLTKIESLFSRIYHITENNLNTHILTGLNTELEILFALIKFLIEYYESTQTESNPESIEDIFLNSYSEVLKLALRLNLNELVLINQILSRHQNPIFRRFFVFKKNKENKTYVQINLEEILKYAEEEDLEIMANYKDIQSGCPMARISRYVQSKISESNPNLKQTTLIKQHMLQIAPILKELKTLYDEGILELNTKA